MGEQVVVVVRSRHSAESLLSFTASSDSFQAFKIASKDYKLFEVLWLNVSNLCQAYRTPAADNLAIKALREQREQRVQQDQQIAQQQMIIQQQQLQNQQYHTQVPGGPSVDDLS